MHDLGAFEVLPADTKGARNKPSALLIHTSATIYG